MVVLAVKSLLILFLFHQLMRHAEAQVCRPQEFHLASERQVINITSWNYPGVYAAGTNCRYRIVAPLDHIVVLNCIFEVFPNGCGTEYLYVSPDGDFQFRDAQSYCRSATISSRSRYRSVALATYSTTAASGARGRLFCRAQAQRQACDCGWTGSGTRITNGRETAKNEFPSMVALRDLRSSQRVFCGATIVSHRHIVTAAHCTAGYTSSPSNIVALVGDHDLSSSTESIYAAMHRIQRIVNHPRYVATGDTVANDIAILLTATTIEWSRGVGPVCLPLRQPADDYAYVNVDIIGWGTIAFAGAKSSTLQKVTLLTIDDRSCRSQYNRSVTTAHICTYDYRGLGQDSCQYDSGGPVMLRQSQQRMQLLGIISYGRVCGIRFSVSVNTRITAHLSWLWRQVGGSVCAA